MFVSEKLLPANCRAIRGASLNLQIRVFFCPGKLVSVSWSFLLTKGFLWASATKATSWDGLDTRCNPDLLRLPACQSFWDFSSHAFAVDFRTPHSSPPQQSDDAFANRSVMVNHPNENEKEQLNFIHQPWHNASNVKLYSAYPQLSVNDLIVNGRSVFVCG